jgi:hypothetical protein
MEQFLVEKATFFDFSFFYFYQKMADYKYEKKIY